MLPKVIAYNVQGGPVSYLPAWRLMQAILAQKIAWQKQGKSGVDVVLLVEHASVYTLGRAAKPEYVKFPIDSGEHEIHHIDRGGQVTWHGPGQVTCYPLLDLHHFKKDLRWYVRQLEEAVIQVVARYGVAAHRHPVHTGVWAGDAKVAAIGVNASRWVTMHGFALNVDPDLRAYDAIVPCGIEDKSVGSLATLKAKGLYSIPLHMSTVRQEVIEELGKALGGATMEVIDCPRLPTLADIVAHKEVVAQEEEASYSSSSTGASLAPPPCISLGTTKV